MRITMAILTTLFLTSGCVAQSIDVGPIDPSLEQPVLEKAIQNTITGKGVSTPTTMAGHFAMHFTGTFEGYDGQGVSFLDHGRMYFVMAAGPWASQEPQASAFINSFALTPG